MNDELIKCIRGLIKQILITGISTSSLIEYLFIFQRHDNLVSCVPEMFVSKWYWLQDLFQCKFNFDKI